MKVTLDVKGPKGAQFWDNTMNYYNLPEIYAWELAAKAIALASYIENLVGQATDPEAMYTVSFHVVMDGKEPKLPPDVKGQVKADRLLFSQMVAVQDAGVAMLADLQKGAHMEILSGQRT